MPSFPPIFNSEHMEKWKHEKVVSKENRGYILQVFPTPGTPVDNIEISSNFQHTYFFSPIHTDELKKPECAIWFCCFPHSK